MLTLKKTNPGFGAVLIDDEATLEPNEQEVLLKVDAVGICGSDLHVFEWTPGYEFVSKAMPVTLGHEFTGTIIKMGSRVSGWSVGQRVAIRPPVTCGVCAACVAGKEDLCIERTSTGLTRNGGFAPLAVMPARNLVAIPDDLDPALASMTEPMTVSAEAVDRAGVKAGSRVLVLGPGSIGQGIALFAREAGASQVVVAGKHDAMRLDVVRKMGFTDVVDFGDNDMATVLAPYLKEGKFDAVIEATGVPAIVQPALGLLAPGGILVIAGIHPKPASVDLTQLVRNHQEIRGSYCAPLSTWPRVVDFIHRNADVVKHMITHQVPLQDCLQGFDLALKKIASKVIVRPNA